MHKNETLENDKSFSLPLERFISEQKQYWTYEITKSSGHHLYSKMMFAADQRKHSEITFVCLEYFRPWLGALYTNNNPFFSSLDAHRVKCWVFKSGGVGMVRSLKCGNVIEAANYFEQIAAFDLSGDWIGDVWGQQCLLLFCKCSEFIMHNNIISITFECFDFRKAFSCFSGHRTLIVKQLCATFELRVLFQSCVNLMEDFWIFHNIILPKMAGLAETYRSQISWRHLWSWIYLFGFIFCQLCAQRRVQQLISSQLLVAYLLYVSRQQKGMHRAQSVQPLQKLKNWFLFVSCVPEQTITAVLSL